MEWTGCVDEYEKLVNRMNKPRVVIDNAACETATLVKVDSARKRGILLEAVQVLTDLELSISKAYISSDGRWFMDVFHVTDPLGLKLSDPSLLSSLEQSLSSPIRTGAVHGGPTALELTGTDRPGLLSEVFAVLSDLRCVVEEAKVWTHNGRIAALMSVSGAVDAKAMVVTLCSVLRGDGDVRSATAAVSSACGVTHAERRLHQMMFADRDYERQGCATAASPPLVAVQNWVERGYSIVSVQCRDRPKLLFDIVCTLTDMDYVVFHGTIDTDGDRARQEFYIRHADGSPISSEAERQRVIQCLQAAIERRESKGLPLELTVVDRPCLLSDVTRAFRENGLSITKAEISTECDVASNVFYVTDSTGNSIDEDTVHAIRQRIGCDCLQVRRTLPVCDATTSRQQETAAGNGGLGLFSIGSLVRRNLYNLGLIRSCS